LRRDAEDLGGAASRDVVGADARCAVTVGDRDEIGFRRTAFVDSQRTALDGDDIVGGAPGIGISRVPCGASSRGTEPSKPTV
jgi:hypothetical protein